MAFAFDSQERVADAQNEWATVDVPAHTYFEFYARGTFVAVISLQFSPDGGATWINRIADLDAELGSTSGVEFSAAAMKWRIGIATGNYTSGAAICRIFGGTA